MRLFHLLPAFALSVSSQALTVSIGLGTRPCGIPVGSLAAYASGGVPPYSYSWDGPNGFTATTDYVSGLEIGIYTVTVTDFEGTIATDQETLVDMPPYDLDAYTDLLPFCDGPNLPYGKFNIEQFFVQYGFTPPGPFTVDGNPTSSQVVAEYTFPVLAAPGAPYTFTIVDGNGCTGTISGVANYQVIWPTIELLNVQPSCSGGNSGGFTLGLGPEGHLQPVPYCELRDSDGDYVPVQPQLSGAPYIGAGPIFAQYSGLPPGDYTFSLPLGYDAGFGLVTCSSPTFAVTVPDDPSCGGVSGRVYADYDEDCTQNSEPGLAGVILEFTPGPYFATTNSQGNYTANLPLGTYTLTQQSNDFAQHCPAPPTSVNITPAPATQDLADTALMAVDVALAIASGPARPGFQLEYAIDLDALTGATSGALQLTMDFDPAVTFVSASPAPANVVGNTITWDLSQVANFSHRDVGVTLQVPPDVGLVGTVLNADASVITANTDADLGNNSANTSVMVTASLDPNDKQVFTSSRYSATEYFIGTDEWLDYTIRFQNTGTDTAFNVIVRDTLSADLDPSTIVWGAASHACGRALTGSGLLTFSFFNILLPDSNVNEPMSHGFVNFRIRPREPVLPGTVLSNAADIYFDFNPPVHTNDAVLTAEMSTGIHARTDDAACYRAVVDGDRLWLFALCDRSAGTVRIASADGGWVRSYGRMVIDPAGTSQTIAGLGAGCYVLWITGEDGSTTSLRFVKH